MKYTDYRKVWKDTMGSIRKGSHIHHIKPLSEGGGNNIGNLIELHPDDHKLIHEMRGDIKAASGVWVMRNGHSLETRKKISEKAKVFNLGNTNKLGKKESKDTRMKKSIAHTGVKKPEHSQKLKRKKFCGRCNKDVSWSVFTRDHVNRDCRQTRSSIDCIAE